MAGQRARLWDECPLPTILDNSAANVRFRPIADIHDPALTPVAEDLAMLSKDDVERPVPEQFRSIFRAIADAFVVGDYRLCDHTIPIVRIVDSETAAWIAESVEDFGAKLAPLNDATWKRSVYLWQDGYWEMIVDLTTATEPVSDLALHTKLYATGDDFELEIYGVYVP
jgi:hypothetical protein